METTVFSRFWLHLMLSTAPNMILLRFSYLAHNLDWWSIFACESTLSPLICTEYWLFPLPLWKLLLAPTLDPYKYSNHMFNREYWSAPLLHSFLGPFSRLQSWFLLYQSSCKYVCFVSIIVAYSIITLNYSAHHLFLPYLQSIQATSAVITLYLSVIISIIFFGLKI